MKVEDLLQAEKSRGGFSKEEREAMWKGVELSVGPAAVSAPTTPEKTRAPSDTGGTPAAPAAGAMTAAMKIGALVSAVALGGALGAAAHATLASPAIVYVDRPVAALPAPSALPPSLAPPTLTPPTSDPPTLTPPTLAASVRPRALPPASPSVSPSPKDPGLARERTLLDMARTALTRGDNASALSALDTHARDFPSSQLAEEREVLAIQALAAATRLPEAQKRAAAFRARYPASPLLPIVKESTTP